MVFSSSSGNPLIIKAQSISQIRVQFFPIHAVFNQLPKTLNHSRFVFLIRDAKPLVLCLQHLYRTLLLPEHAADQSRKQVLCFQRIPFTSVTKKVLNSSSSTKRNGERSLPSQGKPPEVHGNIGFGSSLTPSVSAPMFPLLSTDFTILLVSTTLMICVWPSATCRRPGHTAIVGQRILQNKTGHSDSGILVIQEQPVMQLPECLFSIVIVRIDNGKRFMEQVLCRKDGLPGSPRL